ncbi:outer membrane receptor protein involved in Fe transport [Anseongella ginsenosidimutans]|uniref:Outer membrane receptor protein involved in Fe transport n=1 Tax=Anseongella ginsenosidimutans TaxID=496056 RepID=A0A4R3KSM6_9SPHI|nr:TonB-dependent receptor [Anseongella ginsenosidimutans]TCS87863.1 outer membrane receptor protein involved in Fe transport [Anseongella ginsenosidimutans]
MSGYYLLPVFLLCASLCVQVQAQTPERAEIVDTLQGVVVTAGHLRKKRSEAPVAITQLTSQELSETRASTLDQVLNKASGVFMVNLGNEQHSMSIRQPLSYKSLFLYLEDGIPVRPAGIFNHNALIEMNMAALERIEVVKGPSSAIYGSEAIGGSINFLSGKAPVRPEMYFSMRGDNLGYKRMDLEAGGTFGKGRQGLQVNGYYAFRRHGLQEHSDFDKLALSLRSDVQISAGSKLTTTATLVNYMADMTGAIDSGQFFSRNYPSQHSFTYREVNAFRIRSTYDKRWARGQQSSFTLLYRNNLVGQNPSYRVRDNRNDPLSASGEINENTFQSYGGIFQHTMPLDFWNSRITGGFSLDDSPVHYLAEYIRIRRNESGRYIGYETADSMLTDYRVGMLNTALFAQWEASPLERLKIVATIRYDGFSYNYVNSLPPGAFSGAPDSRDRFSNLSPKLGLTYDLGRGRGLYANFSTGFVPPQVTELYRGVKVPVLEPSVYRNYELGGWLAFPGGNAEISLYRLEGSNEIISILSEEGTTENRNAGKTLHQGLEYTLNYRLPAGIKFRFGGTFARHSYVRYSEEDLRYDGKEMDAAPRWLSNSEVSWHPGFLKSLHIALEWQHMGNYYLDAANTEKYGGFDVMNFRIGANIRGIAAWIHIMNLTDELYATHAAKSAYGKRYSAGAPRAVSIGLGYRFNKNDN